MFLSVLTLIYVFQAGLIETNGELKVFIDQNLSPSKGVFFFFLLVIICIHLKINVFKNT